MATVNVGLSDTFETWRTKTNEIGTAVGDVAQLDSSFSTSDVVSAINETRTDSAIYSPLNIINGGTITTTAGEFVFQVNAQDQLTIDSNGDLTATRNLIATGNVTGVDITASQALSGDTLSVTNNATVGGTLGVTGTTTFTSIVVNGNTTLGDSSSDTVNLSAKVSGNILTTNDSAYDIGTSTVRYSTGYVDYLDAAAGLTTAGTLQVGSNANIDGTLTVDGNSTIGNSSGDSHTVNGSITHNNWIRPNANNTLTIGSSSLRYSTIYATTFDGTSTAAQYADIAERYLADQQYEVGTVMAVGGLYEVTAASSGIAHSVIGVISEFPALLMNKNLEGGSTVALKGRVPVKIAGQVSKGDRLTVAPNERGLAIANNDPSVHSFAIALQNSDGGTVEAVIL